MTNTIYASLRAFIKLATHYHYHAS